MNDYQGLEPLTILGVASFALMCLALGLGAIWIFNRNRCPECGMKDIRHEENIRQCNECGLFF